MGTAGPLSGLQQAVTQLEQLEQPGGRRRTMLRPFPDHPACDRAMSTTLFARHRFSATGHRLFHGWCAAIPPLAR